MTVAKLRERGPGGVPLAGLRTDVSRETSRHNGPVTGFIELLPGTGVVLDGLGTVEFGMTPDEVRALLPAHSIAVTVACEILEPVVYDELRDAHDAWIDGYLEEPGWVWRADIGGATLAFGGDGPGRDDRLGRIRVYGVADPPPVVLDGVDLLAETSAELETVFPATRAEESRADVAGLGLSLRGRRPDGRWSSVYLFGPRPRGWSACCDGDLTCARGGNGLSMTPPNGCFT